MRRKSLWSLFTVLMVAMVSVGFTSCSSDDDDDDKVIESPIVGTWKITAPGLIYTLQFTSKGNVSLVSKIDGKTETSRGTYEVSSGDDCIAKIYWTDSSTPEFWQIKVSGNTMTTQSVFSSSSSKLTWTKQ